MTDTPFEARAAAFGRKWGMGTGSSKKALHRLCLDLQELFLADTSADAILNARIDARRSYLGVIGEIGTGKGEFAEFMKKRHQALHERYSTRVRALVNRWGIPEARTQLQKIAMDLREHFGDDILTRPILQSVLVSPVRYAVIEGIRLSGDIRDLRRLPDFKLVYITAPIEVCYERLVARGENVGDAAKTFEEYKRDREAPNEVEIAQLGATADYRIDNVGSLEEYRVKIEDVLHDLEPVAYG